MDELEAVHDYTSLGQVITMNGSTMEEIILNLSYRIKFTLRTFRRNNTIFKKDLPICL